MSGESAVNSKVVGVVVVDLERAVIGTRSRVGNVFAGRVVLAGSGAVVGGAGGGGGGGVGARRSRWSGCGDYWAAGSGEGDGTGAASDQGKARVQAGRAWNLMAWRGGGAVDVF